MKFVCDRCQTKYSIADERVRGKVLKVKCKTCANVMTVREARRPSAPLSTIGGAGDDGATIVTAAPTMAASAGDSERTVLAPHAPADLVAPRRTTGPVTTLPSPPEPESAPDDGLAWYMALEGRRTGPYSRRQLVDKLLALPRDADLHVWNESLDGWKPPADVPMVASDLAARRKAPPPLPGVTRRPTPIPPPPPGSVPLGPARAPTPPLATRRRTSSIQPVLGAAPAAPPVGAGPPPGRRSSGSHPSIGAALASALPHPSGNSGGDLGLTSGASDALSLLDVGAAPAIGDHHSNGGGHGNGVLRRTTGSHAVVSHPANGSNSDMLQMLNLSGASQLATASGPQLLSAETTGWGTELSIPRARPRPLFIAALGVVGIVCAIIAFTVLRKPKTPPAPPPKSASSDPLASVVDKLADETNRGVAVTPPPAAPEPAPAPAAPIHPTTAPHAAPAVVLRGKGGRRGARAAAARAASAAAAAAAAPTTIASAPPDAANGNPTAARFRDTSRPGLNISAGAAAARPAPSQAEISRVINNNRNGIKNCYQRALLRDSSLTHGKITVQLSIGISGRVKHVGVNGPSQFRALEPCIKEVVSRWAFPQSGDEYGTEFAYVFQGNE